MSERRKFKQRSGSRRIRDDMCFAIARRDDGAIALTIFSGRRSLCRELQPTEAAALADLLIRGAQ